MAAGGSLISGQAVLSAVVVVVLLGAAAWALKRTNTMRRSQVPIVVATAAPVMRPPMAWTRAVATAMMPLQSCLCTV